MGPGGTKLEMPLFTLGTGTVLTREGYLTWPVKNPGLDILDARNSPEGIAIILMQV